MKYVFSILIVLLVLLIIGGISVGTAEIGFFDVLSILFRSDNNDIQTKIIWSYRLPRCLTAIIAGAGLSVSGLILQTVFNNPLAGPSVLGVSTGASLGVAVVMTVFSTTRIVDCLPGALIGALVVLLIIVAVSAAVKSAVVSLIVGIMISYMASSAISLFNFFSSAHTLKSFAVWGLGNFSGVTMSQMTFFAVMCLVGIVMVIIMLKPLNALLLGDNYAAGLGVNVNRCRNFLLFVSGFITAIITAYCGPVVFVGLAVPHIARLIVGTSDYRVLLPACVLTGAVVALSCNLLCVSFPNAGVLPVNAVTPLFGAPVVIYVATRSRNYS